MSPRADLNEVLSTTDEDYFLDDLEQNSLEEDQAFGQLAVDVYQTEKDIVVKAPVAGVKTDDLDIMVTDELVSIKGERKEEKEVDEDRYHSKECYWGAFSRTVTLPAAVVPDKAEAKFKDGILVIRVPKANQSRMMKLKVKTD